MSDRINADRSKDGELKTDMDLGQMDDLNLDFPEAEGPEVKVGSRDPSNPKKEAAIEFMKGVGGGVESAAKSQLNRAMPETDTVVSGISDTFTDIKELKEDLSRELTPMVTTLETAASKVLPKVEKYLPKKFYEKITKKLADRAAARGGDYSGPSKEQMETEQIASELNAIFGEQAAATAATNLEAQRETQKNAFVDRALNSARHKQSTAALTHIYDATRSVELFHKTQHMAYMKKSLELKYKHLFVAKDTYNLLAKSMAAFEKQFEAITQNTSLPDMAKEKTRDYIRKSRTQKYGTAIADAISNIRTKIFNNIKSKAKDVVQQFGQAAEGLGMGAEAWESADEMESMMGGKPKDRIPGWIGKAAGYAMGNPLFRGMLEKVSPYTKDLDNTVGSLKANAAVKIAELKRKWGASDQDSVGGRIKEFIAGFLPDEINAASGTNDLLNKSDEAAQFDVLTRQSIVEIIPGYLGKIWHSIEKVRTGDDNVEEKTFNVVTRKFTTKSELLKDATDQFVGSKSTRESLLNDALAKLQVGAARNKRETNVRDMFKGYEKDVNRFMFNHAVRGELFDPMEIRNFIMRGPDDKTEFSPYILHVTTGFDNNRQDVLRAIYNCLFNEAGDLDNTIVRDINSTITSFRALDRYKTEMPKFMETFGLRHQLASDISADVENKLRSQAAKGNRQAVEALRRHSGFIRDDNELGKEKLVESFVGDLNYGEHIGGYNNQYTRNSKWQELQESDRIRQTAAGKIDQVPILSSIAKLGSSIVGAIGKQFAVMSASDDDKERVAQEWDDKNEARKSRFEDSTAAGLGLRAVDERKAEDVFGKYEAIDSSERERREENFAATLAAELSKPEVVNLTRASAGVDGTMKESVVRVIPDYLDRILKAITGNEGGEPIVSSAGPSPISPAPVGGGVPPTPPGGSSVGLSEETKAIISEVVAESGAPEDVRETLKDTLMRKAEGVSTDLYNKGVETAKNAYTAVKDKAEEFKKDVKEKGFFQASEDTLTAAVDDLKGLASDAKKTVTEKAEKTLDDFKKSKDGKWLAGKIAKLKTEVTDLKKKLEKEYDEYSKTTETGKAIKERIELLEKLIERAEAGGEEYYKLFKEYGEMAFTDPLKFAGVIGSKISTNWHDLTDDLPPIDNPSAWSEYLGQKNEEFQTWFTENVSNTKFGKTVSAWTGAAKTSLDPVMTDLKNFFGKAKTETAEVSSGLWKFFKNKIGIGPEGAADASPAGSSGTLDKIVDILEDWKKQQSNELHAIFEAVKHADGSIGHHAQAMGLPWPYAPIDKAIRATFKATKWAAEQTIDVYKKTYSAALKGAGHAIKGIGNFAAATVKATYNTAAGIGKWLVTKQQYADVYVRTEKGKKLVVSARQQKDPGIFFAKDPTKRVENTRDIDQPCVDEHGELVVTEEDLKNGLVYNDSSPIGKIGSGLLTLGKGYFSLYGKATEAIGRVGGAAIKAIGTGLFGSSEDNYVDIYRKDETGKSPLITRRQQKEDGVFYKESGKRVERSSDIHEEVVDKDGNLLITKDDLEHGLVNVHNKPIGSGGFKGLLSGAGTLLSGLGKFAGHGAVKGLDLYANIYKGLFGLGVGATKGIGKFLGRALGLNRGDGAGGMFDQEAKDATLGTFNLLKLIHTDTGIIAAHFGAPPGGTPPPPESPTPPSAGPIPMPTTGPSSREASTSGTPSASSDLSEAAGAGGSGSLSETLKGWFGNTEFGKKTNGFIGGLSNVFKSIKDGTSIPNKFAEGGFVRGVKDEGPDSEKADSGKKDAHETTGSVKEESSNLTERLSKILGNIIHRNDQTADKKDVSETVEEAGKSLVDTGSEFLDVVSSKFGKMIDDIRSAVKESSEEKKESKEESSKLTGAIDDLRTSIKDAFTPNKESGDADGDGITDGSYADQQKKKGSQEKSKRIDARDTYVHTDWRKKPEEGKSDSGSDGENSGGLFSMLGGLLGKSQAGLGKIGDMVQGLAGKFGGKTGRILGSFGSLFSKAGGLAGKASSAVGGVGGFGGLLGKAGGLLGRIPGAGKLGGLAKNLGGFGAGLSGVVGSIFGRENDRFDLINNYSDRDEETGGILGLNKGAKLGEKLGGGLKSLVDGSKSRLGSFAKMLGGKAGSAKAALSGIADTAKKPGGLGLLAGQAKKFFKGTKWAGDNATEGNLGFFSGLSNQLSNQWDNMDNPDDNFGTRWGKKLGRKLRGGLNKNYKMFGKGINALKNPKGLLKGAAKIISPDGSFIGKQLAKLPGSKAAGALKSAGRFIGKQWTAPIRGVAKLVAKKGGAKAVASGVGKTIANFGGKMLGKSLPAKVLGWAAKKGIGKAALGLAGKGLGMMGANLGGLASGLGGALGSIGLGPLAAAGALGYGAYRMGKGFTAKETMDNLGIKDERDVLFEDRLASALGMNTKVGAKAMRALQSINPVIGLIKGIRGNDNPMTEKEVEQGRAKLNNKIKRGLPGYDKILSEYEKALEDHNWSRARQLCGKEADGIIASMWKHSITGKVVTGLGNLFFGNKNKELDKETIEKTRAKFNSLIKKGGTAGKNAEKLLNKFDDAVAEGDWAQARKIANAEEKGLFGKLFTDSSGNVKWGSVVGAVAGGPIGMLVGSLFNKADVNKPMTEKEVKDSQAWLQKLIDGGNKGAQKILDQFNEAVVEQNWKKARKLVGKDVKSNLEKFGKGLAKGAWIAGRVGAAIMTGGLTELALGFVGDQDAPLKEDEIQKFTKKMNYLIEKKHDKLAEKKLEKFEQACAKQDWKTARKIAKMPHKGWATRAVKATWSWMIGDDEKEMTEQEMQKFRDSMARKIQIGGGTARLAQKKLDAFDDAVGRQNWRKARKIAEAPDDGWATKAAKGVGKGIANTWRFFFGGDGQPMSESEIEQARKEMGWAISEHKKNAQKRLDMFNDYVADEKWTKARQIAKMPYENAAKRAMKAVGSWLFGDKKDALSPTEIEKFQGEMEQQISDGNQKAQKQLDAFNDAVAQENWAKARQIARLKPEGVVQAVGKAINPFNWFKDDYEDCVEKREELEERATDDETGLVNKAIEQFETLVRRQKFSEAMDLADDILKMKPGDMAKKHKLRTDEYDKIIESGQKIVTKIDDAISKEKPGFFPSFKLMRLKSLRNDMVANEGGWTTELLDEYRSRLGNITGTEEYADIDGVEPDVVEEGKKLVDDISKTSEKFSWLGSPIIKTQLANLKSEVKSEPGDWDEVLFTAWRDRLKEIAGEETVDSRDQKKKEEQTNEDEAEVEQSIQEQQQEEEAKAAENTITDPERALWGGMTDLPKEIVDERAKEEAAAAQAKANKPGIMDTVIKGLATTGASTVGPVPMLEPTKSSEPINTGSQNVGTPSPAAPILNQSQGGLRGYENLMKGDASVAKTTEPINTGAANVGKPVPSGMKTRSPSPSNYPHVGERIALMTPTEKLDELDRLDKVYKSGSFGGDDTAAMSALGVDFPDDPDEWEKARESIELERDVPVKDNVENKFKHGGFVKKFASGGFFGKLFGPSLNDQCADMDPLINEFIKKNGIKSSSLGSSDGVVSEPKKFKIGGFATSETPAVDADGNSLVYGEAGTEAIMPIKSKPGNLLSRVGSKLGDILKGKSVGPMDDGSDKASVHAGTEESEPMENMLANELAKTATKKFAKGGFTKKKFALGGIGNFVGNLFSADGMGTNRDLVQILADHIDKHYDEYLKWQETSETPGNPLRFFHDCCPIDPKDLPEDFEDSDLNVDTIEALSEEISKRHHGVKLSSLDRMEERARFNELNRYAKGGGNGLRPTSVSDVPSAIADKAIHGIWRVANGVFSRKDAEEHAANLDHYAFGGFSRFANGGFVNGFSKQNNAINSIVRKSGIDRPFEIKEATSEKDESSKSLSNTEVTSIPNESEYGFGRFFKGVTDFASDHLNPIKNVKRTGKFILDHTIDPFGIGRKTIDTIGDLTGLNRKPEEGKSWSSIEKMKEFMGGSKPAPTPESAPTQAKIDELSKQLAQMVDINTKMFGILQQVLGSDGIKVSGMDVLTEVCAQPAPSSAPQIMQAPAQQSSESGIDLRKKSS